MSLTETRPAVDVMRELGARLDDLEDEAIDLLGTAGIPALAELLAEVRGVRQALVLCERAIEDLLTDVMIEDRMEIPGVGVVERRFGKTRKGWDAEGLLSKVMRLALDPDETGEVTADVPEAVELVRVALLASAPMTRSNAWRTGALKAMGIDPDEWCETEPGRISVQITRNGDDS